MTTMPQLRENLGVATCCGKCHFHAKQVLRDCVANTVNSVQNCCQQAQPSEVELGALAA